MKRLYCIILSLILFSFSYGDNEYTAYIKRVNSIGTFIGDTTQGVEYNFDICIEPRNNGEVLKDAYFMPESTITTGKMTMTLEKIEVIRGEKRNNGFKFSSDEKGKVDDLELNVRGKINLKNGIGDLVGTERVKIGDVQEKNHKRGVYLIFDYGILKKEDAVSLRVVRDMDLGVAIAGQTLKSSKPAIVEISGIKDEIIKVEIDEGTTIKNEKGDELKVDLLFEDKGFEKIRSKKVKEIKSNNDSVEIKINGYSKTQKDTPSGVYKGAFKVRVIY